MPYSWKVSILLLISLGFVAGTHSRSAAQPITDFGGYGNSLGITGGPDGALWFAITNPAAIGHITTAGVVTRFLLQPGHSANYITVGSDAALWFTETSSNNIGRMNIGGIVTNEFPSPRLIAFRMELR
jgi:streptogramin lyase